ncbi:hypothetical protein JXA32_07520 [Candidatus Sumerlaeota bacterium]|nr:hypothetical protein [Candidatus Sumerlaeota bacterium]
MIAPRLDDQRKFTMNVIASWEHRMGGEKPRRMSIWKNPPVFFFGAWTMMAALHQFAPETPRLPSPLNWLGLAFLAIGSALDLQSVLRLLLARTTVFPYRDSQTLITTGVYRFTRNPIYLGMALILLGAALMLGTLTPLLAIPMFVWLMDRFVIRMEEGMLEERFGDAYRTYCRQTRRWLMFFFIVAASAAQAREYTSFDVVGDSISEGGNPEFYPDTGPGWVHILFGEYQSEPAIQRLWPRIVTNNYAVSGTTTSDWATTGSAPMDDLLSGEPDLVAVLLGFNDLSDFLTDDIVTTSEQALYRQNLNTIIDRLQAMPSSPDILVINLYDMADGLSESIPATSSFYYYHLWSPEILAMNSIIEDVAAQQGCMFIDLFQVFFHHCYGRDIGDYEPLDSLYIMPDLYDVHPVTEGHLAIYRTVYERLLSLKYEKQMAWWYFF